VYILPVERKWRDNHLSSVREQKKLIMREIDIENVKKLKSMKGITVLEAPQDITRVYLGSE
jgi:flavoprotein